MILIYKLVIFFMSFGIYSFTQGLIFPHKLIKIGYNVKYKVKVTSLESDSSFIEYIELLRKPGKFAGQEKIIWKYTPNDSASIQIVKKICSVFKTNPQDTTQCLTFNRFLINEETGLIENKNEIWMHPPRSRYLSILEFAPFPYLNKQKKEYDFGITLGAGWGKFVGAKVNSKYNIVSKEKDSIIISATSQSTLGVVKATFVVNRCGFYKMVYTIFGEFKITLQQVD